MRKFATGYYRRSVVDGDDDVTTTTTRRRRRRRKISSAINYTSRSIDVPCTRSVGVEQTLDGGQREVNTATEQSTDHRGTAGRGAGRPASIPTTGVTREGHPPERGIASSSGLARRSHHAPVGRSVRVAARRTLRQTWHTTSEISAIDRRSETPCKPSIVALLRPSVRPSVHPSIRVVGHLVGLPWQPVRRRYRSSSASWEPTACGGTVCTARLVLRARRVGT